ncbi:cation diffusion facilitator family transporter [Subtercola lobariae]|uniref:Cobalt-zinc-cadmium resistance protein n=1 Tax=Subtercola lobariae TaxID=1588641 RepID=A0A917B1Y4_9MICO|nr:cation transporter [Subtercola lobariae]GGF17767.1 cobalt-zinc-cadmium resistance protein [Subtercola lobariae]
MAAVYSRSVQARAERRLLLVSISVSTILSAGALTFGILSGTRIIVFDGTYMSIGLILSWISLRASSLSTSGPSRRFPFGRDALTPLVVLIQGIAIAGTLLYAAGDAVVLIRAGGDAVNPGAIAVYGAVTAGVGFLTSWWLRAQRSGSDLVSAEQSQWRAGAVLSAMMLLGAVVAVSLAGAGLDGVVRFVDPVLVLVACAMLVLVPIRLIRSGMNELLEGAPSLELSSAIHVAVASVQDTYGLPQPTIRSGKVGRKLYVEVDFIVRGSDWDVSGEDRVRRAIIAALEPLGFDVWAYVALTADPDLI